MKVKKILASLCIIGLLGTSNLTAQAASYSFAFEFNGTDDTQSTNWFKKADNESKYVISLKKTSGTCRSNLASNRIFGCKVHRKGNNDNVDRYHTFSKYVTSYGIEYQSSVSKGDKMRLAGKQDDSNVSKWDERLTIAGNFTP